MKISRFNVNAFDEIITENQAYWLGFLIGDGCFNRDSLRLELNEQDKNHLLKLNEFLEGDYEPYITSKNCQLICFNSRVFVKNMQKYIPENKTYNTITRPKIDSGLVSHFYRGILDSDGWITEHKLKFNSQYEFGFCNYNLSFIQEMQNWFITELSKQVGSIRFRKFNASNGSVAQLIIGGNLNFVKLYNLLYLNSPENARLDRKYDKATGFYNIITNKPDMRFRKNKTLC